MKITGLLLVTLTITSFDSSLSLEPKPCNLNFGNGTCSDCLRERFNLASDVFWGTAFAGRGSYIYPKCSLKTSSRPWEKVLSSIYITANPQITSSPGCDQNLAKSFIIFDQRSYIFFLFDYGNSTRLVTPAAEAVLADGPEAYALASQLCNLNLGQVISDSSFNCTALPTTQCYPDISVQQLAEVSALTTSTSTTMTKAVSETVPTPGAETCNPRIGNGTCSDCLKERFDLASDVFWGTYNGISATIHPKCSLKTSSTYWDDKLIISLSVDNTTNSSPGCDPYLANSLTNLHSDRSYIFFLVDYASKGGLKHIFTLAAEPVLADGSEAYALAIQLCNANQGQIQGSSFNCMDFRPTNCSTDISVQQLSDVSSKSTTTSDVSEAVTTTATPSTTTPYCEQADDHLAIRFQHSAEGILVLGKVKQISTTPLEYFVDTSCGLTYQLQPNYTILESPNATCLLLTNAFSNGNGSYAMLLSRSRPSYLLAMPVYSNSNETWLTVTRLCSLWRLPSSGPECPKENIDPLLQGGCYQDLSASTIDTLPPIDNHCHQLISDSFNKRVEKAHYVVSGRVLSIRPSEGSFKFQAQCDIYAATASNFRIPGDIFITKEVDGCLAIDDYAVRNNISMILFFGELFQIVAKEIVLTNETSLGTYGSVCGVALRPSYAYYKAGLCQALLPPTEKCYPDLSISAVITSRADEFPAPVKPGPDCCIEASSNKFSVVRDQSLDVIWATLLSLETETISENNLTVATLKGRCYMIAGSPDRPYYYQPTLSVLLKASILLEPIWIGRDYIVPIQRRRHESAAAFLPNIDYELSGPIIQATKLAWTHMCNGDCLQKTSTGITLDYADICGPKTCGNRSTDCSKTYFSDFTCPGGSDKLETRLTATATRQASFWAEVVALKEISANYSGNFVGGPNYSDNRTAIKVRPVCQIYGSSSTKPPLPTAELTFFASECFANIHDNSTILRLNQQYIFFVEADTLTLTGAPIIADEISMKLAQKSCSLDVPDFPIFSDDVSLLNGTCPIANPLPFLCLKSIAVASVSAESRYIPDDHPDDQLIFGWPIWQVVTVASVACIVTLIAIIFLTVFIRRRRRLHGNVLDPAIASINELSDDEDFLVERNNSSPNSLDQPLVLPISRTSYSHPTANSNTPSRRSPARSTAEVLRQLATDDASDNLLDEI